VKLHELELNSHQTVTTGESAQVMPAPLPHPIIDDLSALNIDNMTPREALDVLYRLKEQL